MVKDKRAHHNAEAFSACSHDWKLVIVEQADRQKDKNLTHRPKEADQKRVLHEHGVIQAFLQTKVVMNLDAIDVN